MPVILSQSTQASLPISGPAYDREELVPGIVHIGVGNFHRAHQARYADAILASGEEGARQWGISGVCILPSDSRMRDVMTRQDRLYTLWARGEEVGSSSIQVLGPHCEFLFAPEEHAKVVARLSAETTKVVTLTITEKGYCCHLGTGALDTTLPAIQDDLRTLAAGETGLKTALGFLAAAAQRRMLAGAPSLAVLSCDNVQKNGSKLKRCMLEFVTLAGGAELLAFVESAWTFPNSMVDRITPATTDALRETLSKDFGIEDGWPVLSEDFIQWVVEDQFPAGRPPWEKVLAGTCLLVEDVLPYELMKLRLLNGSHQAVAYCGILAGYRAVDDAMANPSIRSFVASYMDAVGPAVPPVEGIDLEVYKKKLCARFSNPSIKDQLLRLTEDARNRIQVACVPCLETAREGHPTLAALLACWIRYLAHGQDELGQGFAQSTDAALEELQPLAAEAWTAASVGQDARGSLHGTTKFLKAAFAPDENTDGARARVWDLAEQVAQFLLQLSSAGVLVMLADASTWAAQQGS